ncbi:MAG: response regulator [Desulfomicrobium escambiense]|nr:response regulator [Desulfomicrobium escambiense]
MLDDEGYHVEGMTDAVAALRTLEQFNPNLVITDLKMPGMDGIRFMEEVKKRNAECDVIMMTAFATVETAVSAMKMGAADYITKRSAILSSFGSLS